MFGGEASFGHGLGYGAVDFFDLFGGHGGPLWVEEAPDPAEEVSKPHRCRTSLFFCFLRTNCADASSTLGAVTEKKKVLSRNGILSSLLMDV